MYINHCIFFMLKCLEILLIIFETKINCCFDIAAEKRRKNESPYTGSRTCDWALDTEWESQDRALVWRYYTVAAWPESWHHYGVCISRYCDGSSQDLFPHFEWLFIGLFHFTCLMFRYRHWFFWSSMCTYWHNQHCELLKKGNIGSY